MRMRSGALPEHAVIALSTLACSIPPGPGGLGRHFEELIELAVASGAPDFQYYCPRVDASAPASEHARRAQPILGGGKFLALTPLRWNYGWATYASNVTYDYGLSRALTTPRVGLTALAGQALHSFGLARTSGAQVLGLVAPNCHVDHVVQRQAAARAQYPVERGWLNGALRRRTIREYDLADVILVSSVHQRQTFLAAGVQADKLVMHELNAHPRFQRRAEPPKSETFEVAYVGRFDLMKGIPLLLDAFFAAAEPHWRLTLQGGFGTHAMRVYTQRRVADDARVNLVPLGDPSRLLEAAHVFVHPSYTDGFGYGPVEAMAVGVPVIVTDQTGMRERMTEADGQVVPAGNVDALVGALRTVARDLGY
jgi:glycosyltransferase involved in cell wall biosynthesis